MSVVVSPMPVFRAVDNTGAPLVGGKLSTYIAGTSTPQATWVDSTQTVQNTNPVILNARGEANVWLDPTLTYKYVLTDAANNPVWTVDNLRGPMFASGPRTFAPVIVFAGGGTLNITFQQGTYTIIGNICTFMIYLAWSSPAAPVGLATLNLPVPPKFTQAFAAAYAAGFTVPSLGWIIGPGVLYGNLYVNGASGVAVQGTHFANTAGQFVVSGSYQI